MYLYTFFLKEIIRFKEDKKNKKIRKYF
uniref:Uncharacterized protein n=1 Tax=Lepeophtheirus salmonis TaxID=72036 RepID=A0A0K2UX51_LEPSM